MAKDTLLILFTIVIQALTSIEPALGFPSPKNTENLCLTPFCIHTASKVLKNMDPGVSPCDNFYRFACGNYLKSTAIPSRKEAITPISTQSDQIRDSIKLSLQRLNSPEDPRPIKLARNFYSTCLNESAIQTDPFHKVIQFLGGWPMLSDKKWKESEFNWLKIFYKLTKIGYTVDYFMGLNINIDVKSLKKYTLYMDEPSLLANNRVLKDNYDKYMINILTTLGANNENLEKDVENLIEFIRELIDISKELHDASLDSIDKIYNPVTIAELNKNYSSIPWNQFISTMVSSKVPMKDSDIVIVLSPSYLNKLMELLDKTPKKIQANYIMWNVFRSSLPYLSKKIRDKSIKFLDNGLLRRFERREDECFFMIEKKLADLLDALYLWDNFKDKKIKQSAVEIAGNVYKQLIKVLRDIDWLDDETKRHFLSTAENISSEVAYQDETLDKLSLEKTYKDLEIIENEYLKSSLIVDKFYRQVLAENLRKPVDIFDLDGSSVMEVSAFYLKSSNKMRISAGMLQGIYFNNYQPNYMNYGAIGMVVGHELTHAYDFMKFYMENTEFKYAKWWSPATNKTWFNKIKCFVDQYDNYVDEETGRKLDGKQTIDENLADTGGFDLSYNAYKDWLENNSPEEKLPGLESFTAGQMFWIAGASSWCSKFRPERIKVQIENDEHSLPEFRILGAFSNSKEFSSDFNCPVGSKMNPVNKCSVF